MKLTIKCKTCSKPADIQSEFPMGNLVMYVWQCGHTELREKLKASDGDSETALTNGRVAVNGLESPTNPLQSNLTFDPTLQSIDGSKMAYDFQAAGVRFVETTGINALIADAMGLGKTIQSLLVLKRNHERLTPTLILVKSSLIFQWTREYKEWASAEPFAVMPVVSRDNLIPGFKVYIMSMDLIGRKGILEKLKALNIKSVIIDEVHCFKDPSSARTRALITLIQESKIEYKIALSGTPIKNRADEYFTILNLLAPEHFWSMDRFRRRWLIQNDKGAYTRINPYYLDDFKELTSRWIIRREKHEVLTNLPPLTRNYLSVEIEDQAIKDSYNKQVSLFDNFLNNTANITSKDILGWLAKFRAITGQAKCQAALDYTAEFLDSTDENISIGVHHTSVRDTLYYVLEAAGYTVLKFSGEDSSYRKDQVLARFAAGDARTLVINMIAGGVGLNLQNCANALVLERQWNSADEEQFEGRFHRDGQVKAVNVTYMIANGTIDEFFHDMVERKRKILGETLSSWALTEDGEAMKELTEKVRYTKL